MAGQPEFRSLAAFSRPSEVRSNGSGAVCLLATNCQRACLRGMANGRSAATRPPAPRIVRWTRSTLPVPLWWPSLSLPLGTC